MVNIKNRVIIILMVLFMLSTVIGASTFIQLRKIQVLMYSNFVTTNYEVGRAIESMDLDAIEYLRSNISMSISALDPKIEPNLHEYMTGLNQLLVRVIAEEITIEDLNKLNFHSELYKLEVKYLSTGLYPKIKIEDDVLKLIYYIKHTI